MRTVSTAEVATAEDAREELPERVQEALGELAGAAKEGLMALSVGVGPGVLHELMEAEVEEVVGPKGKHDPGRSAVRHGHEPSSVTLGARRVAVSRPRVRSTEGEREVALDFEVRGLARLRGPHRRDARHAHEPEPRRRPPRRGDARRDRAQGSHQRRGARDHHRGPEGPARAVGGSSENAVVATALLADLVERGLDTAQGVLCVLDRAKALAKAVRDVLGERTPVQRCVRHKERNVLEHLPERDRPAVRRRLRRAWERDDHVRAEEELRALASELERSHPGAAATNPYCEADAAVQDEGNSELMRSG